MHKLRAKRSLLLRGRLRRVRVCLLALPASQGFHNYVGFERYWLQHLPKHVPPSTCPNITAFQQACAQCDEESWAYAHRCAGAWTWIRPTIIHDTHAAFAAWAARATRFTPPAFQPGDVVIQSRCSNDTVLVHPEYGPVGFSFYANIPPAATRITVVADQHHRAPLCALLHDAQLAWLRARFPDAAVTLTGSRDPHLDFARLLLAPILFKDAQSSFGLWAALANRGEVWSVPLLPTYTNTTEPDLGPHWHWVDVPVLYPHVAAAAGITLDQPDAILQWLRDN